MNNSELSEKINSSKIWNSSSLQLHVKCSEMNYKYRKDYWKYDKPVPLYQYLNPVLDCLIKQLPEAIPFHHPVNVELLGIPDYHDIIKCPMDLSTIRSKLHVGQYKNGWEFVDDVWLMFDNAKLYNKKSSYVYKCCLKLIDLFKTIIDVPMKKLGYCCGQNFKLESKTLFCCMKQDCIIPKSASYWIYRDRYQLCKSCYSEIKSSVIVLPSDDGTISINKEEFFEKMNLERKELFVKCVNCGIKLHKICMCALEDFWQEGYLCHICTKYSSKVNASKFNGESYFKNFSSENLQKTKLSAHIEERVNSFLGNKSYKSKIVIRLVYNAKKYVEVKNGAKTWYVDAGIWPKQFPYTAKTLLAFQKIDGREVCFFALFVQEYDSECPLPNTRQIYISYLDSIYFFTPKELRTAVYHEILLGYLDYVKNRGFMKVYVWSCPSKKGEDYFFYCHPKAQKNPSTQKLTQWYKVMLKKGIEEGIVKEYKDVYTQAVKDNVKYAYDLPYFDGDFFPISLEAEISKLNHIAKKLSTEGKTLCQLNEQDHSKLSESEAEIHENKHKKCRKRLKKKKNTHSAIADPLTDKIMQIFFKFGEVFLVIHLNQNMNMSGLMTIDPDPFISSEVLYSREVFLEFCRENDHVFSSLRHAKFSTMILLFELHKENRNAFYCNSCKKILETGFHCIICKDFDLCSTCYAINGHDHEMQNLTLNSKSQSCLCFQEKIEDLYKSQLNSLNHLSVCKAAKCSKAASIKTLLHHFDKCNDSKVCIWCTCAFHLVFRHSHSCQIINCQMEMCQKIKFFNKCVFQNFENEPFCIVGVLSEQKFCGTYYTCSKLHSVFNQNSQQSVSTSFDTYETQPIQNNQESCAVNKISDNRKSIGHPSFLNVEQLNESNSVCNPNWKTNISLCESTKNKNQSREENNSNLNPYSYAELDVTNMPTTPKSVTSTYQMPTLSVLNNGSNSCLPQYASDSVKFDGNHMLDTGTPFNQHSSPSTTKSLFLSNNNEIERAYPKDTNITSNVQTEKSEFNPSPKLLFRNDKNSTSIAIQQNSLNEINTKIEVCSRLSCNKRNTAFSKDCHIYNLGKNMPKIVSYKDCVLPNIQNINGSSNISLTSSLTGNLKVQNMHQNVSDVTTLNPEVKSFYDKSSEQQSLPRDKIIDYNKPNLSFYANNTHNYSFNYSPLYIESKKKPSNNVSKTSSTSQSLDFEPSHLKESKRENSMNKQHISLLSFSKAFGSKRAILNSVYSPVNNFHS